jgi:PadR family transcriptional regulator PadR
MTDTSPLRRFQKNLNGGLIALVLLAILDEAKEDLYGTEIAALIDDADDGPPLFHKGSIYPVLRNLARQKWLTSRIVPSYSGPARRYYAITAAGREGLREWRRLWRESRDFVAVFLGDVPPRRA